MRKNAVRRKYVENQLVEAVLVSSSYAGVLKLLGLKPAGANYGGIKRHIAELGLDTSHWKGQGWNKGQTIGPKRPIEDYLIDNTGRSFPHMGSNSLRKRLINEGLKNAQCECCGITEWNGKPAPLELDHINGNHDDNRFENLQILCPNCHAQTPTYRGRNKASVEKTKEKVERKRKEKELKPPYDHNALKPEEIERRLALLTEVNFLKFGWVQKVASILGVSHAQSRRFIDKYYDGEVYKRSSPSKP